MTIAIGPRARFVRRHTGGRVHGIVVRMTLVTGADDATHDPLARATERYCVAWQSHAIPPQFDAVMRNPLEMMRADAVDGCARG